MFYMLSEYFISMKDRSEVTSIAYVIIIISFLSPFFEIFLYWCNKPLDYYAINFQDFLYSDVRLGAWHLIILSISLTMFAQKQIQHNL